VALAMFERSYHRIGEIIPAFVTLCESRLKTGTGGKTEKP
jgi:hypothetical protein